MLRKSYSKNEEYMHVTFLVSGINQCLDVSKKGIEEAAYHGSSKNYVYWALVTQRSTSVYLLF